MAEYIDREAAIAAVKLIIGDQDHECKAMMDFYHALWNIPAADVAPVLRGKNVTSMHPVDEFICSECGVDITDFCRYDPKEDACYEYEFKYCPYCGAKMDGE